MRRKCMMKKILVLGLSLMLLAGSLSGCGSQDVNVGNNGAVESLAGETAGNSGPSTSANAGTGADSSSASQDAYIQSLLQANTKPMDWTSIQYYQGEAVNIYRQHNGSEDLERNQDIYIRDKHNKDTLIVTNAPAEFVDTWFVSEEGYCIATIHNTLARIESDGTEKYRVTIGEAIPDICQMADGRIMLIVKDGAGNHKLVEMNGETGEYSFVEPFDFGRDTRVFIAAHEDKLILLNSKGFWNVNPETGELAEEISMSIYSDILPYAIKDFKLLGGMTVEFLRKSDVVVWMPAEIEKYREQVVVQCAYDTTWMQAMIDEFNKNNYQYYAVLEKYERDSETFAEYTAGIERKVVAGEGPDLIATDCIDESLFIENGWLEDLASYMKTSGMDELDYFPVTFESDRVGEHIYSANLNISMSGLYIKKEILGNRTEPSVEELLDSLLAYTEPSVLNDRWRCQTVLNYFLAGSEDLWGCVDWENRTCDFMSDFFFKAMEVALLYGDEGNELPAVGQLRNTKTFYNYVNNEQMDLAGEYYIGYIFEDGCRPWMVGGNAMAINSNASCKDGAWAVLEYFLSEEGQLQKDLRQADIGLKFSYRYCPVNIYAFEAMVLLEQEETALYEYQYKGDTRAVYKGGEGQITLRDVYHWDKDAYRATYNLKPEDAEELRNQLYEVRYMPGKASEILDIVYEEAKMYFWGRSSLYDVCEKIDVKVQEYLDAYEE